jgi:tetratricopeptide (TPR) repeat protein
VLSLLAQAYEGLGDTPTAVEKLRQAILLSPDRASLYLEFAWLSFEHKSFQVGIDMINAGLARLPRSPQLYLARGILHVQKGEYEKADQDFARADLLNPRQAVGTGAQALSALQADHLDQAISFARANLKAHPADALSAYVLAEGLLKNGAHPGSAEFGEALAAAQKAVREKPDFIAAADVLSRMYLQSGETDAAIAECRRVLAINPDDETALYRLVRALKKRGSESDLAEVPGLLERLTASRKRMQQREAQASRYRLVEP